MGVIGGLCFRCFCRPRTRRAEVPFFAVNRAPQVTRPGRIIALSAAATVLTRPLDSHDRSAQ
jgi:hypothetical protein